MFSICLFLCCNEKEKELKSLFPSGADKVSEVLLLLDKIAQQLPYEDKQTHSRNCYIAISGEWVVNNKDYGEFIKVNVDSVTDFKMLGHETALKLKNYMVLLLKNNITGFTSRGENCFLYFLSSKYSSSEIEDRFIILNNFNCNHLNQIGYKQIDSLYAMKLVKFVY